MPSPPPAALLVMGVSGSGKTTVGRALAVALGWSFVDADDFHPPANRAKMAAGRPLDDADRTPWLDALRAHLDRCRQRREPCVLACSALKAGYRAQLVADPASVRVVFLHGSRALLRSRLAARRDHFMPPELLDSQLAALEPPTATAALALDIAASPPVLVENIRAAFHL